MLKWEERLLRNIEETSNNYIDIKGLGIGRVVSLAPLQIITGDLPLFKDNLYINPDLLANTREFTTLTGTIGGSTTTISNGSISFKSSLKVGDLVVLQELNKKTYLVMFKVEKGV